MKRNTKALSFILAFSMVISSYALIKGENKNYAILPEKQENLGEYKEEDLDKKLKLKK